jgi:proteasome lid subunit RPN8/RPN11
MRIGKAHRDAIVAHAEEAAPVECCGYLRARDGRVEDVFRAQNLRNSRYGYELDPDSALAANKLDDQGFEVGIYHSHPRSAAEPSRQDVNLAFYPNWTYLIVSLDGERGPDVRAWRIVDGRVEEEELVVD